jgi:hypothetical protein
MSIESSSSSRPAGGAGSYYRYDFLRDKHRLHARYIGTWDEQVARDAMGAFRRALEGAGAGGQPFTLLDDFRDWQLQTPEVNAMAKGFEEIWRGFPIRRNAMVIPSAQVRMQVRRSLTDFQLSKIFEGYEEADKWLAEVEPGAHS